MFRVGNVLCAVVVLLVAIETVTSHGFGGGMSHSSRHHHGRHQHHHHRQHHHGQHCRNRFDIKPTFYSPKGFEVYVKRPNDSVQYFAFEMTINEQDSGVPDVALNTSTLQYGKYFLSDPEVIIRPGDTLNISWSMGLSDGNALSGNWNLNVDQRMIKTNCTCENVTGRDRNRTPLFPTRASNSPRPTPTRTSISEIPPWSRPTTMTRRPRPSSTTTTTTSTTTEATTTVSGQLEFANLGLAEFDSSEYDLFDCEIDPTTNLCRANLIDVRLSGRPEKLIASPRDEEVRALRAIIDSLLNQPCRRAPRTTRLTLPNPRPRGASTFDWLAHVRDSLSKTPQLKSLASTAVQNARPRGNVIVFDVETQQDKLMLLQLCKEAGLSTVQDYD